MAMRMTIGDAKLLYHKYGPAIFDDEWALYEQDCKAKDGLKNSNYLHALCLTDRMFSRTSQQLSMLTGSESDGFISILRDTFVQLLQRIRQKNGIARIIVLDSGPGESLLEIQKDFLDVLKITSARATQPVGHFITCDTDMVRIETPHDRITDDDPADKIKATVYFQNPGLTQMLSKSFDTLWESLHDQQQVELPGVIR